MKGCVVGCSDLVFVSGSWGNLCFFGSCASSLICCCWFRCFRLFVWGCSWGSFYDWDGSALVILSMNGVGSWGGSSLMAEPSGVVKNICFFISLVGSFCSSWSFRFSGKGRFGWGIRVGVVMSAGNGDWKSVLFCCKLNCAFDDWAWKDLGPLDFFSLPIYRRVRFCGSVIMSLEGFGLGNWYSRSQVRRWVGSMSLQSEGGRSCSGGLS